MAKVNSAELQLWKPTEEVKNWLSQVAAVEIEVAKLTEDYPQELCRGGYCFKNSKLIHKFGKRLAEKLENVIALKNGDFKEVVERRPASLVNVRPCDPIVGLESEFGEVHSCLQDEQVGIVGLYGIGGVGKTTLLKQINNKIFDTLDNLDIVIWVEVSSDLKLEKVQEDIGEKMGFSEDKWKCKSLDEKATDIFMVLSQKKFVLLLDDLWEWIDLTKVGIPHPNSLNGSKVIFTTRKEGVCYQMNAKKIRVKCLAWEKAWELFQEKVGEETLSFHPDIPKLAEIVAKKCGGLPLALIPTGRAMAGKRTPQEWKYAIKHLPEFSGMENEVFPLLKSSYDNLRDDKVKSCFLFCALFPEDFPIDKTALIDYWNGEGILDGYDDRGEAENEGYHFISTLVLASLLEDEGNNVKMNDVIRELALWIAMECGEMKDNYFVEAGSQLIEAPEVKRWERARRVSLTRNRIRNLMETPNCPNLLTLFLCDNCLKVIASEFFQFMPSLRVLDLSRNHNLKELPSEIAKLVSLEYLNLSETDIQKLPDELTALYKLKYLNLEYTRKLNIIPPRFIFSFPELEVLRMYDCGDSSGAAEETSILSIGNNELLVAELLHLKHLIALTIDIKSKYSLQSYLSSENLPSCTQTLLLCFLSSLEQLNVLSLTNMTRLKVLVIRACESLQELKIEWASERREIQVQKDLYNSPIPSERCFDSLCRVYIDHCPKLRDLTWLILAPNLTVLQVQNCPKMQEIISVEKLNEVAEVVGNLFAFGKLEELGLWDLPELKSIYGSALPFPHLMGMDVDKCPKLKQLPLDSNSAKDHKIVIRGKEHWWKGLKWEDEATENTFLPCFEDW